MTRVSPRIRLGGFRGPLPPAPRSHSFKRPRQTFRGALEPRAASGGPLSPRIEQWVFRTGTAPGRPEQQPLLCP
jgi:hypothetical protein